MTPDEAVEQAIAHARLSGWELPPEWRDRLVAAAGSKEKLAQLRHEILAEVARAARAEGEEYRRTGHRDRIKDS